MRVDVYRNLNDDCISVKSRDSGAVVDHVDRVAVRDVEFVVQPAGRDRVRVEERKNVHAFVRGIRDQVPADTYSGVDITYNPYEHDSFVRRKDETPVKRAEMAVVSTSGVVATGVE